MVGKVIWDERIYGPNDYQEALRNPDNNSVSMGLMESGGENGFFALYTMIINQNKRIRQKVRNNLRLYVCNQAGSIAEEILVSRKKCDFYVIATPNKFKLVQYKIFNGKWIKNGDLGGMGKLALHNLMEKIDAGEIE